MSTIGNNFTFGAAGTEDTLYGFSYLDIKLAARESSDTDAFRLDSTVSGNLYYNAGSAATPQYLKITNYTSSGGVQIRLTGVYLNNVKVSGTDSKVYWMPEANESSIPGVGTTNPIAAFTVKAVDNFDGAFDTTGGSVSNDTTSTDSATALITLTAVNDAPVITTNGGLPVSLTISENTETVATVIATDVDTGDTKTWSISGTDHGKFSINSETGVLTFNPTPNYEAPPEGVSDNIYEVDVTVTDSGSLSSTIGYTVTVANVNEMPSNTAPLGGIADSGHKVVFDAGSGNGHASVISVSDPDNFVISATQQLHVDLLLNGAGAANNTLTIAAGSAAVTGSGTNHITVQGTQAEVNAALATLTFNGQPGFGFDNIRMVTTDVAVNGGIGGGLTTESSNISISAGNPSVVSVGVPNAGHYNQTTTLEFTVVFDQAVTFTGTGTPQLTLTVGSSTILASYSGDGSESNTLHFSYDIALDDSDSDGIVIESLVFNNGTIVNSAGAAADLTLNGVGPTLGVIIDNTADAGDDLTVTVADALVSNTEKTAVEYSVAGLDADATAVVTFTDTEGVKVIGAEGTANLSSLAEGQIMVSVMATDTAGNTASATSTFITLDKTIATPTASLDIDSGTSDGITNDATLTFSAIADDVTRTFSVDSGPAASSYTAPTADGEHTVQITDVDTAGNTASSSILTFTLDTTADTGTALAVTFGGDYVNNVQKSAVSFTVAGLDANTTGTVTFTGTSGDPIVVSGVTNGVNLGVDLSSLGEGVITASITAIDAAGNTASGANDTAIKDTVGPTAVSVGELSDNALKAGDTGVVNISFNEAVIGIDLIDATAQSSVVTSIAGNANSATFSFTPNANTVSPANTISLNMAGITDLAGNVGVGEVHLGSYSVDTVLPTITSLTSATADGTYAIGSMVNITATTSEAIKEGSTFEVTLDTGAKVTLIYATATTLTGSYTVAVGQTSTDLTVASFTAGTVHDMADASGNALTSTTLPGINIDTGSAIVIDGVRPTLESITLSDAALKIGDTVTATFIFSEAVTNFTADDVTVANGSAIAGLYSADGGKTWTGTFTPNETIDASNVVTVGAGWNDLAGNTAGAGNTSANYTVDTVRPTVAITLSDTVLKAGETTTVTFKFSEDVHNFSVEDVTGVGTGQLTNFAMVDANTYTATLTPTADIEEGTNTISVGSGWADLADNDGNAPVGTSSSANYTVDTVRPMVAITLGDSVLKAGETTTVTFEFSEDVQNFSAADVTGVGSGQLTDFTMVDANTYTATLTPTVDIEVGTNTISVGSDWADLADNDGNAPVGTSSSANYTVDTKVPTPSYTGAIYNSTSNVLTLTGSNFDSLKSFSEIFSALTDKSSQFDLTKLSWNIDNDNAKFYNFGAQGAVTAIHIVDGSTLQIQLSGSLAADIEADLRYGSKGSSVWDHVVIADGFSMDSSGNVATTDGSGVTVMGPLNEAGMPMVYGADFVEGTVDNETAGTLLQSYSFDSPFTNNPVKVTEFGFNASVDTLHVTGSSAADLDVFGSAIGGNLSEGVGLQDVNGTSLIFLHGWNADTTGGIRNSSVVSFDDGSVLRTNSTGVSETLSGGTHDDLLMAGSGGDRLLGNAGDDRLIGGAGNDQIYGGSGNDTLFGGGGSDYLVGGSGSDTFVFAGNAGEHATIADFSVTQDWLLLNQPFSEQFVSATASGNDTLLTFADTDATVRLLGVNSDAFLESGHFNTTPVFMAGGVNVMNGSMLG